MLKTADEYVGKAEQAVKDQGLDGLDKYAFLYGYIGRQLVLLCDELDHIKGHGLRPDHAGERITEVDADAHKLQILYYTDDGDASVGINCGVHVAAVWVNGNWLDAGYFDQETVERWIEQIEREMKE